MTRVEARIAVRMLGVLVVGLSIRPMMSSVLALPSVFRWLDPSVAQSRLPPPWHWTFGFIVSSMFFTLCVLFGVLLSRRAGRVMALLLPETQP